MLQFMAKLLRLMATFSNLRSKWYLATFKTIQPILHALKLKGECYVYIIHVIYQELHYVSITCM